MRWKLSNLACFFSGSYGVSGCFLFRARLGIGPFVITLNSSKYFLPFFKLFNFRKLEIEFQPCEIISNFSMLFHVFLSFTVSNISTWNCNRWKKYIFHLYIYASTGTLVLNLRLWLVTASVCGTIERFAVPTNKPFAFDAVTGNTNKTGQWMYQLATNIENNAALCYKWYNEQPALSYIDSLHTSDSNCPCILNQAVNDARFRHVGHKLEGDLECYDLSQTEYLTDSSNIAN